MSTTTKPHIDTFTDSLIHKGLSDRDAANKVREFCKEHGEVLCEGAYYYVNARRAKLKKWAEQDAMIEALPLITEDMSRCQDISKRGDTWIVSWEEQHPAYGTMSCPVDSVSKGFELEAPTSTALPVEINGDWRWAEPEDVGRLLVEFLGYDKILKLMESVG